MEERRLRDDDVNYERDNHTKDESDTIGEDKGKEKANG